MNYTLAPEVGSVFECWYPAHNIVGIPLEYVPERICVSRVERVPHIAIKEFLTEAFKRWGTARIHGTCTATLQARTFELEVAAAEYPPKLQFVLINPSDPHDLPEPVSDVFEQMFDDRLQMLEIAKSVVVPDGLMLAVAFEPS